MLKMNSKAFALDQMHAGFWPANLGFRLEKFRTEHVSPAREVE